MNGRALGAAAAVMLAACGAEPVAPPPLVKAAVLRAEDTVRFEASAAAHRCEGKQGVVFEAVGAGNGLLVWLRDPGDSLVDSFNVLGVKDTVTRRGAVVSVRYIAQSVPHTVSLDSGLVVVLPADSSGARALTIKGSGLDVIGGARTAVDASFAALPPPRDSLTCARGR